MLSTFSMLSETDKKLFVAKIIHNMTYSQSSYDTMEALVCMWDEYPRRATTFFTQTNQLNYGTATN